MSLPATDYISKYKAVAEELQDTIPLYLTDIHVFVLNYLHPAGKCTFFDLFNATRRYKRQMDYPALQQRLADLVSYGYAKQKPAKTRNIKFYYSITTQGKDLLQRYCDTLERICKEG